VVSPVTGQGVRIALLPPLGTEVRAILSSNGDAEAVEGVLIQAAEEGIVLEVDRGRHLHRIPADVLLGLERSLGRNHARGAFQGLGIGILGGGLVWGGLLALTADRSPDCIYFCSRESNFLVGAAVGGVLGGAVGLVVGAANGTGQWQPIW
jgi:hypothetical protein